MPSVSQLTRLKRCVATVDLGEGDSVTVGFDLNRITPAWVSEAQARDEESDTQSLPKALSEVMMDWDVTNDDGTAYPPTAENLSVFSYPIQAELLSAILTAAVPSSAEGNSLSTGSSATAPAEDASTTSSMTSPNGSDTSDSLNVSASPSPT